MTVLGDPRGAFKAITIDASSGRGAQVEFPSGSVGDKSIVTSFGSSKNELYGVQNCLNKSAYVYTFGHSPQQSQFTVGMTLFLRDNCASSLSGLKAHLDAYRASRVSAAGREQVKLTVGDAVYSGHLVGQRVESANAELNLVNVTYTCILLEA